MRLLARILLVCTMTLAGSGCGGIIVDRVGSKSVVGILRRDLRSGDFEMCVPSGTRRYRCEMLEMPETQAPQRWESNPLYRPPFIDTMYP